MHFDVTSLVFQAELEKMLATIKILQAKNASTGTISMSKRLMAIQETFSANLGPNNPALVIKNGDINKNQKCQTICNTSTSITPITENGKAETANSSTVPSKPCKPNSLILVANPQSLAPMSNGQVRLVSQPRHAAASAKEWTNILSRVHYSPSLYI